MLSFLSAMEARPAPTCSVKLHCHWALSLHHWPAPSWLNSVVLELYCCWAPLLLSSVAAFSLLNDEGDIVLPLSAGGPWPGRATLSSPTSGNRIAGLCPGGAASCWVGLHWCCTVDRRWQEGAWGGSIWSHGFLWGAIADPAEPLQGCQGIRCHGTRTGGAPWTAVIRLVGVIGPRRL